MAQYPIYRPYTKDMEWKVKEHPPLTRNLKTAKTPYIHNILLLTQYSSNIWIIARKHDLEKPIRKIPIRPKSPKMPKNGIFKDIQDPMQSLSKYPEYSKGPKTSKTELRKSSFFALFEVFFPDPFFAPFSTKKHEKRIQIPDPPFSGPQIQDSEPLGNPLRIA